MQNTYVMVGNADSCPDIRYLTGFSAPDDVVVAVSGKKRVLIVNDMEYGRALSEARGCEVVSHSQLLGVRKRGGEAALVKAWLVREGLPAEVICSGRYFPFCVAAALNDEGIRAVPGEDAGLRQARMVKSPEEVSFIAEVQNTARAAMSAAGRMIADAVPGSDGILNLDGKTLTSEMLRSEIRKVCMERGCIDEGTIAAGGEQAVNPHECGHGPLRTGEWIVVDIFPRSLDTGYHGDMTRTFANGRVSGRRMDMYKAVEEAQKLALSMLGPGVSGASVHRAVADFFYVSGFRTAFGEEGASGFFHSTGHGVGLEIHEEPRLSSRGGMLSAGMTVTVEPGLYYPGLGGVRIEDLALVTGDGCMVL